MRAKERTHSGHYANVALFLPTEETPEDMSYTHTRNVTQKRERGILHRPVEKTA